MILRSLLTALLALVVFHFSYPLLPRKYYYVTGQQRRNLDRAERFVFGTDSPAAVILGSSMSLKLDDRLLGPAWEKLTFPGCSILTAFEILRRSERIPRVLLIECNQCCREANEDILTEVFNPLLRLPRRHTRIFFEEARPSHFLIPLTEAGLAKALNLPGSTASLTPELYAQVIEVNRQHLDTDLPLAPIQQRVEAVAEHVDYYLSQGCTCIFYEMPVDPELRDLKTPTTVRNAMRTRFPENGYDWVSFDRNARYETSDGIHLQREGARRLTAELLRQVDAILARHSNSRSPGACPANSNPLDGGNSGT